MFRHLAAQDGVDAGRAPRLCVTETKLALRGFAVRSAAALRFARAAIVLQNQRRTVTRKKTVLMVYRHPLSTNMGDDGYFGDQSFLERVTRRIVFI